MKNVDDLNRVEKISKEIEHKSEQLAQGGESTPYITKGKRSAELFASLSLLGLFSRWTEVRKVMKLATTYTDLKNTGRIDAYLNKKRKRLAGEKKKQMPTRRVATNDDEDDD